MSADAPPPAGPTDAATVALRESEARLHLIVENAREYAIFSLDLDRTITSWNSGAERILGYAHDEAIGRSADVIFVEEDRAADVPAREARTALAEGRAADERWHQRRDGSRFWASGVMTVMRDDHGTPLGFVKIFRDQTAQVQARQALEDSRRRLAEALEETERARDAAQAATQAKDRFLAVLSHELRTPLTPLLLASQILLRDRSLPAHVQQALAIVERNARLETQLVDDLLDVTRIASGKLELHRTPLRLHQVVAMAADVVLPDLEVRGQRLAVAPMAGDDALLGDAKRLQQVFWNLLKNASKFSPDGSAIEVGVGRAGDVLEVRVSDRGVGFAPEAADRIFAAFEQGGEAVTHRYGGLGLGLAIARAVVEAHGGSVQAHSDGPGQGATFTVRLPAGA